MNRSRVILAVLFALLISVLATAQESKKMDGVSDETRERIEKYFNELDLSEEQKPQFSEITRKYAVQMMEVKDNTVKSRYEKYKDIKNIQSKKDKEMQVLLNKDQYATYKEVQEEIREEFRARAKERRK